MSKDTPTSTARPTCRCGTPIYNEPEIFDEAECEARGRADRAAGVSSMDPPYAAGQPFYAWERGYHGEAP